MHCSKHFTSRCIMWTEEIAPGQGFLPGRSGKSIIGGDFEHIRVSQAAAAHASTMQYHHAFQQAYLQDAVGADSRKPQVFPEEQVGFCKVLVAETPAFFDDKDRIALFSQAHGRDGGSETGTDYDEIEELLKILHPGSHARPLTDDS